MFSKIKAIDFKSITLYPILLGIYPVFALLGVNISEVEPSVAWRPVAALSLSAFLILLFFRFLLRDWHRSALSVSLLTLLFFLYGRIYSFLKTVELAGFLLGRHRFMVIVWAGLAILAIWFAVKKVKNPQVLTPTLNLLSLLLLIFPSFQTVSYLISQSKAAHELAEQQVSMQRMYLPMGYAPDIYYIILDAYGRADVLQEMFDYDNSTFLNELKSRGFYVAECSQSNYAQSMLSITSSLNLNYLENLTDQIDPTSSNRAPLRVLGKQNAARAFLDSQGYNTVSFATSFPASEWDDADFYLIQPPVGMNEFEIMLADTTFARFIMDFTPQTPEKRTGEWYRRRTLFTLAQLKDVVPDIPGPKFVFAHLVIPHHPFVFGPNGEEVNEAISNVNGVPIFPIYKQGYSDHVTFINGQMEEFIQIIFESSSNPPIIIIQGDHGPEPFDINENRMKNLNVYYFPDGTDDLYPTITPVNTFRLIFNKYFAQDYELLNDLSYYSAYDVPYNYEIVPNDCVN